MLLLYGYLAGLLLTLLLGVRLLVAIFSTKSRRALSEYPVLHCLAVSVCFLFWFVPWGSSLGFVAGKLDSTRDRFSLHNVPFQARPNVRIAFSRILRDRYGIYCQPLRGCIVFSHNDATFERSYDSVMLSAIKSHFGRDIIAECQRAAYDETCK